MSEYVTTLRFKLLSVPSRCSREIKGDVKCYGKSLHITVRGSAASERADRNRAVGYRNRGREMSQRFKERDQEGAELPGASRPAFR